MGDTDHFDVEAFMARFPALEVEHAMEILGDSAFLYEKVLRRMVDMGATHISDMNQSLRIDNDLKTFSIKVHGVKGVLSQLGHTELAQQAYALERAAKEQDFTFCDKHYDGFRDAFESFYTEVAQQVAGGEDDNARQDRPERSIADFKTLLSAAAIAADDFDVLLSIDLLTPLCRFRFNEPADSYLRDALQALDLFQPLPALNDIMALLALCDEAAPVAGMEVYDA